MEMLPSALVPLFPSILTITSAGIPFGLIEFLALFFGLVWTALNFYQYFPLWQAFLEDAAASLFDNDPVPVTVDDDELPTIDVLLPAYQEGAVIEQSIESIRAADYPQDRLNLYVIVEPQDDDTRSALQRISERRFTELVVPRSYPGEPNKPRALNFGFEHTDSEIIGIIDAEDVVDPDLFREAACEIIDGRDFVQGRLDMVNENDGWINMLFRAEYGFWYELVMPAFQKVGYPLPLSGTSCLFRRSLLIAATVQRRERYGDGIPRDGRLWTGDHRLYGWTPWDHTNVTEDFELGLFLWEQGFDVGYLKATTAEESPVSFNGWMNQRTRWKKGKIQTFMKYIRHPPAGLRAKAHMFWQSFLPHLGPLNISGVVLLVLFANLAGYEAGLIVKSVLSLGLAFVVMSMVSFGIGYWRASDTPVVTRSRRLATVSLTVLFYWFLQWTADVRAIQKSYYGRFEWERVTHYGRNALGANPITSDTNTAQVFSSRQQYAILALVILVGTYLRIVDLGSMSLWADEIYSITHRGAMSVPGMLIVPNDPHPPLYFLLLHSWMEAVGATATSARLLSVIFSIATIPAVFLLGRELFDDHVGLIAAGILSLSSFHVHFGRIARMYSLFALLTVLSWLFFARLRSETRPPAVGYILATAALLYTHAFGVFVLVAQYGYMVLSEARGGISTAWWVRVQAVLVVILLPLLSFFGWLIVGPILNSTAGPAIGWIPIPSTVAVTRTIMAFLGYPIHYPILTESRGLWMISVGLLVTALGLVFLSWMYYTPEDGYQINASWQTGQVALLLVVPVIVPFIVSYVYAPIYAPRYTLPASIGLYLLMAAGIVHIPSWRVRRLILALFLLGSLTLLGGYFTADTQEDWRGATATLEGNVQPGDLLVFQPGWIESNVDYYFAGSLPESASISHGTLSPAEHEDLTERFNRHDRVWLVAYQENPSRSIQEILEGRDRVEVFRQGRITIYRYDKVE